MNEDLRRSNVVRHLIKIKLVNLDNRTKYESYRVAMRLLDRAKRHKDFAMCVAAVAVAESIIADRCQSYLYFKESTFMEHHEKEDKYVSTKVMLEKCGRHFKKFSLSIKPRSDRSIVTKDLFAECLQWLKFRNEILHSFAKSKPGNPTKKKGEFQHNALDAAEDGLRLTKLIIKWHKEQLQITNKKEII